MTKVEGYPFIPFQMKINGVLIFDFEEIKIRFKISIICNNKRLSIMPQFIVHPLKDEEIKELVM